MRQTKLTYDLDPNLTRNSLILENIRIAAEESRHGSGNPTRRSNGPGLCHRLQIWLASLLAWPTSPISPLPTSYVICDRSFVLLSPRSAVKRNGMLVHLPDVIRVLLQYGVIVRRLRIR
jgi:hypothetical protein